MKYCSDCCNVVDEMEQTSYQYENDICPYCDGSNIVEYKEEINVQ